MQELQETQAAGDMREAAALANGMRRNLGKIHTHGQRTASIVRGCWNTRARAPASAPPWT